MASVLVTVFLLCNPAADPSVKLIAHRGGVVDAHHAENSLSALREAIQRGYWMVEVDLRRTKDGEVLVQHDKEFMRFYGVNKDAAELTWEEIRKLKPQNGAEPPTCFRDYAALCRGKTFLMLDTKEENGENGFFDKMEQILRDNDLLTSAFCIGSSAMKARFKGKARVAVSREGLDAAVAAGEKMADLYFLFEHGKTLDEATVKKALSLNVPVVASVNELHYVLRRGKSTPEGDIANLLKWGVTYFQVDSKYEGCFKEKPLP